MKNRYILALFVVATMIVIIGAMFKIMHWPGSSIMLIAGMLTQAICGLLLVIKLIKGNQKPDSFLDK